ncbi:hypothetical protein [Phorcysia thermohydrogeniphila]|uniref:Lipoprotein n=1 Tax=Phorcysia thermohydrogeniphila TaxID=936138 RepID=A0A4R1GE66_9BACT|nr:hypothetical protein [Phorcysia thermohydrogeniphila]TCK06474.1 hypothetical protein CLV27_0275 [Phorcysia thermohydrogeniphila]
MRKLLLASLLLFLPACGGGMGSESIYFSELQRGVKQQDVKCCANWDDTNSICLAYTIPPPLTFTFKVSYDYCLDFSGCGGQNFHFSPVDTTVELLPSSSLPDELKDGNTLEYLSSLISVESVDLSEGGEAEGAISLSSTLVEEMERYYSTYGKPLLFTLKVNLVYVGDDGVTKITVPYQTFIEFANFIYETNDMCTTGG